MRCKNCGTDNDDNRYICETCGSPLYDEEDIAVKSNDNEKTQTFSAVQSSNTNRQQNGVGNQNNSDNGYYNVLNNQNEDEKQKNSDKKNIITIGILVVILIAIIASVVAISHNKDEDSSSAAQSELTRISSTSQKITEEITEEKTTEKTAEKTTATKWIINTSSSGGGKTEGDGKYKNGDKVVLFARADEGYVFDGWYSDGIKVSNEKKYVFYANENASFSAVFNPVETQPITEATTESAAVTPEETTPEVVFGE